MQLGGGVREVALAAFLTGIAATAGAFFWGRLIDSMRWRATVVMFSSIATLALTAMTYFAHDVNSVTWIWTAMGFLGAGAGPATNLMIMQRSKIEDWSDTFSWTSLISNGGIVVGMVAGFVWLTYSAGDIRSYSLACAAMAGFAAIAALPYYLRERRDNRESPSRATPALLVRRAFGQVLPFAAAFGKNARSIATSRVRPKASATMLFFVALGLFFVSGNLFYTPYTPYLKDNGVTDAQVFIAYTALSVSKVIYLPFNNRLVTSGGGEQRMAKIAYAPRIGGTVIAVVAALLAAGHPNTIFLVTLAAFVSVDLAFSLWNTTTTSSFMKIVPRGKEGKMFGISQAVTGFGLLVGSIAGGEISASLGYAASFCAAIAALGVSLLLLRASFSRRRVSAALEVKAPG